MVARVLNGHPGPPRRLFPAAASFESINRPWDTVDRERFLVVEQQKISEVMVVTEALRPARGRLTRN